MINEYKVGSMIFYDGNIGKYYYGTILNVKTDRVKNHVYMKVLNRNNDVFNLNLDESTMKQWSTRPNKNLGV
tara:strand:+ start:771 stop:986 length:216 start_codon:yes stop_codon:yes gene_type:complete